MDSIQHSLIPENDLYRLLLEKEEELHKQQIRYKAIMDALPGFIFIFDDEFYLRDVLLSPNMKLFHSMKELIGMDGREIYSPEVSKLLISNIHGCLKDGQIREIEYPVYLNELTFYYQARIVPYEGNKVLAMIEDIGDRIRRIEELAEAKKREEANKMKSTFLANMSHEIRTPLNAIVGFSEIIMSDEYPDNKQEFMEIIRKNSDLLLQLINDILDISRMESGKMEINLINTNINDLIEEVGNIHRIKMPAGVELNVIFPSENINISTDPNRVKQILHNFLSNAIKHTTKGRITLSAELDKEDNSLIFSVSDTGTGIEEDKLESIFERFEKLDSFVQGTGLGLSICKSISEHLGGKIGATSALGKGSTFTFSLPLQKEKNSTGSLHTSNIISSYRPATIPGNKKKILVIEPNDIDFEFISNTLKDEYTLLRTTNGKDAIETFHTNSPHLILVNLFLPETNGVEAITSIRNVTADIPVIAITSHGNYTEQELALKRGCTDIVFKPYSTSRLQDAVVAHI